MAEELKIKTVTPFQASLRRPLVYVTQEKVLPWRVERLVRETQGRTGTIETMRELVDNDVDRLLLAA
jgi:hypothetical protein